MSAPVALARWSWRLTRREWRQHLLVTSLITAALTLVTLSALTVNNITRANPDYGDATHLVKVAANGEPLDADTNRVLRSFGPADVTYWRVPVNEVGDATTFELSDTGIRSALGGRNLTLLEGVMPTSLGQIAITRRLQRSLSKSIGDPIRSAGSPNITQTLVGVIEDPNDLERSLGVVAPGQLAQADFVITALRLNESQLTSVMSKLGAGVLRVEKIEAEGNRVVSFFVLALLSGVAMLELGLLCSAGFAVLARRRLR